MQKNAIIFVFFVTVVNREDAGVKDISGSGSGYGGGGGHKKGGYGHGSGYSALSGYGSGYGSGHGGYYYGKKGGKGGKGKGKFVKTLVIGVSSKYATLIILCVATAKLMFKKAIGMSAIALLLLAIVWYKKKHNDYDRNIVVDPHDRFYVLTPGDDQPKLAYRGYMNEHPPVLEE